MERVTPKTTGQRRAVGKLLLAIVGLMIVLGGTILFRGIDRPNAPAPATPTIEPAPPAPTTAENELADSEAKMVVEHILTLPFEPVETSADLEKLLSNVATGDYLAELEAQWQELVAQGWTLDGSPRIVESEVGEVAKGRAEVAACIDASSVRTLDAAGEPIGEVATTPAQHVFILEQGPDGEWRIAAHGFPDDPSC